MKKLFIVILIGMGVGLVWMLPRVSRAEETTVTLPDGTTLPARRIYTSSNPTDHLIEAIAVKDMKMIESLIAKGIDVNSAGSSGETPLMEALGDDKAQILDFLLEHGADVNRTASFAGLELSPLETAVSNGYTVAAG